MFLIFSSSEVIVRALAVDGVRSKHNVSITELIVHRDNVCTDERMDGGFCCCCSWHDMVLCVPRNSSGSDDDMMLCTLLLHSTGVECSRLLRPGFDFAVYFTSGLFKSASFLARRDSAKITNFSWDSSIWIAISSICQKRNCWRFNFKIE